MSNQYDNESPVLSGPAPLQEVENALVPMSLAATLTKTEIEQQLAAAHQWPRSPARARDNMISLATMDEEMAAECIFSIPRGGKSIRGPSIRFAEIVLSAWANVRCAARVTFEDRIERFVEAEALFHDLETNVGYVARVRRRIELKRGRKTVDDDMISLAGAAAVSIARRNAILGAVPKPVWKKALDAVESVVRGDIKTLGERRDAALSYFNKLGVPTERILKALEVNHVDDVSLEHLLDLNGMRSAIRTGESTLDQLFPVERDLGPKPETLTEKLQMLSTVDPETGEIKQAIQDAAAGGPGFMQDGKRIPPQEVLRSDAGPPLPSGGAGASDNRPPVVEAPVSPAETVNVPQRTRGSRRIQTTLERIQADGDKAAAKGARALNEWWDTLTSDEVALVTATMDEAWKATASKNEGLL